MSTPTPEPIRLPDLPDLPSAGDLFGAFMFAVVVIAVVLIIRWVAVALLSRGHWVYEIDDENDALLYIGECADIGKRMGWHITRQRALPDGNPRKWWWRSHPDVQANRWPSRHTWYATREAAKAEERDRIRRKKPPANGIKYKGIVTGGE